MCEGVKQVLLKLQGRTVHLNEFRDGRDICGVAGCLVVEDYQPAPAQPLTLSLRTSLESACTAILFFLRVLLQTDIRGLSGKKAELYIGRGAGPCGRTKTRS